MNNDRPSSKLTRIVMRVIPRESEGYFALKKLGLPSLSSQKSSVTNRWPSVYN